MSWAHGTRRIVRKWSAKHDRPKRLWAKHCARPRRGHRRDSHRRNRRDHGHRARGRRRFHHRDYNLRDLLRRSRICAARGAQIARLEEIVEKLERKLRKARRPKDIAALLVERALGSEAFARDFQAALRFIPVITRNRRYLLSLAAATRRVWLKEAWKAQGGVRSRDPRLARIVVNAAMAALRAAPAKRKGR